MANMRAFTDRYLAGRETEEISILDLGSMDVNGSYRTLFDHAMWYYQGLDLTPGNNVDIVLSDPYIWTEIPSQSIDVVVSGQALEHIEFFWLTMLEVSRVLKPGGLCCIIAPSGGYEHRYPVDCWRFYPDGFSALARFSALEVLECKTQWESVGAYSDDSDVWNDTVLVARKPDSGRLKTIVQLFRRVVLRWALAI